jgi:putative membrane protein
MRTLGKAAFLAALVTAAGPALAATNAGPSPPAESRPAHPGQEPAQEPPQTAQQHPQQQQQQQQQQQSQNGNLSREDMTFAREAAQSGKAEVAAGELALAKAASKETRQFAHTLISDHEMANQELMRIAQKQHMQLPQQPSPVDEQELQTLKGLNGTAFDKAFGSNEVKDHQLAIARFEREAQQGQDPALRGFAESNLSVLRKHLEVAKKVALAG